MLTKADEINIDNLINSVRSIEEATNTTSNKEEISKIRQYCIDAVNDYWDTNNNIVSIINKNRDLWKNPYIKGSDDGFIDGNRHKLGKYDAVENWYFTQGAFEIYGKEHYGEAIWISVGNIHGTKKRTGYCGSWEDHNMDTSGWIADSVSINCDECDCKGDLIDEMFTVRGESVKKPYSVDNLKKYNWSIERWTQLKRMADKTRIRTEEIVRRFTHALELRIATATEKLNNMTEASSCSYVKVVADI